MSAFHQSFGWIAAGICGVVGLWGVFMARRETVPKQFFWGIWVAVVAMLVQITFGVLSMSIDEINPGNQHVFYGIVIAVTLVFAYIYRTQFRKRPALYYGLLLLFLMGLGIRGISAVGGNF